MPTHRLLSRTALRFFEDFRYQRLGIRCVLRDISWPTLLEQLQAVTQ